MGGHSKRPCDESLPCAFCTQPKINHPLRSAKDILFCLEPFRTLKQEAFVTLSMDSANQLIKRRVVTVGLLDQSLAHPREVFAGPLKDRAASIIISHNHPSNMAEPSRQDITCTQSLLAASLIIGIPIQDHVITTKSGYFSFLEQGLIDIVTDNKGNERDFRVKI